MTAMGHETTRRAFLLGSAAVVASVAVPTLAKVLAAAWPAGGWIPGFDRDAGNDNGGFRVPRQYVELLERIFDHQVRVISESFTVNVHPPVVAGRSPETEHALMEVAQCCADEMMSAAISRG